MILSRQNLYIAAVTGILALSAGLAIVFGYISPDSWYYIFLAQSLRQGHGCNLHGAYMAVYPCGYPAVLALTAPVASLAGLMISSKLTNLALLALSFWFVLRASKNVFVATVVVVNPVTLLLGMYTWSENLLLFCVCGIWFALSQLQADPKNRWAYAGLALCLITGCFTRYFFGPFAFILFLCAWLSYGRTMAIRIFPAFCVAGVVFLVFQKFNLDTTGYTTGMPRVPAPEHALLLIRQFLIAFSGEAVLILATAGLLLGPSYKKLRLKPEITPESLFIISAGLGFLALAFALRLHTLFDPFGERTIGYGVVWLIAGGIGLFVHPKTADTYPLAALFICGVFCVLFADGWSIPQSLMDMKDGSYAFPAANLKALQGPKAPDVVVSFALPVVMLESGNVDNVNELYYGPQTIVLSPLTGPDNPPETPQAFRKRIADTHSTGCVFDFTPFASSDDFSAYLSSTTLIDHRFSGPSKTVERANFDPHMQTWLQGVFRRGKEVPCHEILSQ